MRYFILQLARILALLTTLALLQTCGGGGRRGAVPGGPSGFSKDLTGYWEAVLSDSDFDGQRDEIPLHYLFMDITSHDRHGIAGQLYRQLGTARSEAPLTGFTGNGKFQLSASIDGEEITISGDFRSFVQDYEGEHLVADYRSSSGASATIVLLSVNSHILPTELGSSMGELASLNRDPGTSGRPIIFVHGLDSNPGAWDAMVSKLQADGKLNGFAVWRFSYDTRQGFETIGPEFYKLAGDEGIRDQNPIIIAHSMGGLVSRSYIALGGSFSKLVTLGTPHAGTPLGVGGIFTGPGTIEMSPCSPEIMALYDHDIAFDNSPDFAVVSGKITGGWKWVVVRSYTVWGHTVNVWAYLWQFDRNYNTGLKAGWLFVHASGFGDNDGAVPTASANYWADICDGFPLPVLAPINYEHDKHLTNYDHFMLQDPAAAPDVYDFVVGQIASAD